VNLPRGGRSTGQLVAETKINNTNGGGKKIFTKKQLKVKKPGREKKRTKTTAFGGKIKRNIKAPKPRKTRT